MIADSPALSGLTIGALPLTPTFDPGVTEYAVSTSNGQNKVTATCDDEDASITLLLGETEITNGSSPSWAVGENALTVRVSKGDLETVYTITVTKT